MAEDKYYDLWQYGDQLESTKVRGNTYKYIGKEFHVNSQNKVESWAKVQDRSGVELVMPYERLKKI